MNLQASNYGVLGEKILWPPGFVALQRMPGELLHGLQLLINERTVKRWYFRARTTLAFKYVNT